MKNIELTLYYGHAEGGPKTREFDTIAEAEAYMATLGRVQITSGQESPRRYIVFTENSRGIPCRITRDNTPLFVNHSVSNTNDNYEQEIHKIAESFTPSYFVINDVSCSMINKALKEAIEEFRNTIHAREMAKKDNEIEKLTTAAKGHHFMSKKFADALTEKENEIERLKNSIHTATSRLKAICQNRRISESDQEKILSAFTKTDNP